MMSNNIRECQLTKDEDGDILCNILHLFDEVNSIFEILANVIKLRSYGLSAFSINVIACVLISTTRLVVLVRKLVGT